MGSAQFSEILTRAYLFASKVPSTLYTFLFAAIFLYFILNASKAKRTLQKFVAYTFPMERLWHRSTFVDVSIFVISKFSKRALNIASVALITFVMTWATYNIGKEFGNSTKLPESPAILFALAILLFLLADCAAFLSHLLQHKVKFFWEFHKVHHTATFLTPLTTTRFHPVGDGIDLVFYSVVVIIVSLIASLWTNVGMVHLMTYEVGLEVFFTFALLAQLQHSHFAISYGPLERVFISPRMHQLHHSVKREHWGKNLGARLSVWDWMYGSGYKHPRGEDIVFGLGEGEAEDKLYQSVLNSYRLPFVRAFKHLKIQVRIKPHRSSAEPDRAS